MKELLQVWGRMAGKTYSAVGRSEHQPSAPIPKENTTSKRKRRVVALLIAGILGFCSGIYILLGNPYESIFDWKVTFGVDGEIFEMWRKPAVDLYLQVYLFNVTNSEAFVAGREPLKVQEVGPYVYKELLEHGNVTFNSNGTLSSIPLHPLQWQPEMSYPHTQEDLLVLPNIAMLSIGHVGADSNPFTRMAINALLRSTGSRPLVKMTAWDFMFGHSSPLVTLGNSFLPGWIKFDKLGLIDRMYDFETDFETIYTGEGAPELAGLLDTWRGSRHLPHWEGECGNIHKASDGAKFLGDLTEGDEVLFYRKSLCRAAPMIKTGEGWVDGLWGHRYAFHNNTLDNGAREEKNKCFCRKGNCLPEGLIDVTDCYYGFPIALSYPHFLDGAAILNHRIEGLSPDPALHSSAMWLQPRSGLPLSVAARFQINMALQHDMSSMHSLTSFSEMTLPLLWFEFRMFGLPEPMGNLFRLYLNILPAAQKVLMWVLLVVGPLLLLTAGTLVWLGRNKSIPRTLYNPKRRGSRFTNSIRRMSMDVESKLQGVYGPCEIPMDGNESFSPFLHSVDLNNSDSDETEAHVSEERRSSLIKTQVIKIKDLSISFGNRIQGNLGGMAKSIKSLSNILSQEPEQSSSMESNDEAANHNEGFNSESCHSGSEEDHSTRVENTDDELCHVEIMDDGSEFDIPLNNHRRRRSLEFSSLENKMNRLETGHHFTEEETKDMLSRLPYLPEDQV